MRNLALSTRTQLGGRRVAVFVAGLFALWAAAWICRQALPVAWSPSADLAYWATAKALVWGGFPVAFWWGRLPGGQLAFIGIRRDSVRAGLLLGAALAGGWVLISLGRAAVGGLTVTGAAPLTAAYAIAMTPILEELVFRGYLQSALVARGTPFAVVNPLIAGLFLLMHVLGWAFQGVAAANLFSPYPISIVVLSLLLGYARQRSGALLASVVLHVANNAFSIFVS